MPRPRSCADKGLSRACNGLISGRDFVCFFRCFLSRSISAFASCFAVSVVSAACRASFASYGVRPFSFSPFFPDHGAPESFPYTARFPCRHSDRAPLIFFLCFLSSSERSSYG